MTQGELEKLVQAHGKIFSDLEIRIMDDIVRRIKINGFSTASADWQISRLQQLEKSEKDIKEWVRIALNTSEEEIEHIFSDEVYEQYMKHGRAYEVNGMQQIPFEENQELQQLIDAVGQQTNDTFKNMTNSLGFVKQDPSGHLQPISLTDFYRTTLDAAIMDIHSGAFNYQTVLTRTIEDMTKSGIRWIDYGSGRHNRVDVAARRAVMTGFRQIQGKINEQVADQLGTDSYEVTYHVGARPTHQPWQGKVWTMQQLRDVCGLGSVEGLHGANCYHDYNAFIPGVSVRTYTDEQLKKMIDAENEPKSYNGKEYTTYEALQQQRKMETAMRKTRRDIKLLEDGEADEESILLKKARYHGQMQAYQEFSKQMKLPLQKDRIYQDGLKGKFDISEKQYQKLKQEEELRKEIKAAVQERKVRYARFSDRFQEYNNGQKDIITTRRLLNNLNKSSVGKETVEYIMEHPEVNILMCYKIDNEDGLYGKQFGDDIWIYASKTKTVQKTAETLIHEVTHHKYNIGGSQRAECVCFAQEMKHRMRKSKLTGSELKDIIKIVKELYPELPWR